VVSVWICEQDPFPASPLAQLRFDLREATEGRVLHPDLRIEVLQLRRWAAQREALLATPAGRWFWFFNEAAGATVVPEAADHPAMEEAMDVLKHFQRDEQLGQMVRRRIDFEREVNGWRQAQEAAEAATREANARAEALRVEKERERAEKEAARAAEERERAEKERERAEKERERAEKERERSGREEAERHAAAAERHAAALAAELAALRARLGEG
jgi:hypothetical protein